MSTRYAEIIESLRQMDYVADTEIATSLFLAEELGKPLLIEGEAGVGKTEVARVLARLRNTELIRLQCYEGLDFNAALYEWNYQRQIVSIRLNEHTEERKLGIDDLYSREYLLHRPILKALLADRRTVLLLDEIDRADEEFEALLLETLAEYQLSIPELGTIRATHPPYVILTSNRTRELTDALRRRCLYLWIPYPSFQKELEVIRLQVPELERGARAAGDRVRAGVAARETEEGARPRRGDRLGACLTEHRCPCPRARRRGADGRRAAQGP